MRRLIRFGIAISLTAMSPAFAGTDVFRGDDAHSGIYSGLPITTAPAIKWKFHTGGLVIASPAVDNDLVLIGSGDANFYAIDKKSGVQKWLFHARARIASSAAVSNGFVYFESYDGNLYALDVTSGLLKWKFSTKGERRFAAKNIHGALPEAETMPDPFDVYLSSPTVWKGQVYFGSGDGNVYALNAVTGALKWRFQTGDVVHASPAVAEGTVYVGSWDHYFYALDAQSGQEKWRFKTGTDAKIHNQEGIQSSAAVSDGIVYFGCRDSHLYALDAKTGKERWSYGTGTAWVISSPAVRSGVVYAATSDSSTFFALDAKTGAKLFSLDFNKWPFFSSPAIIGNFAYIGSHNGKLIAVDLEKRKKAWDFDTDGAKRSAALSKPDGSPNYEAVYAGNFYDDLVSANAEMMKTGMVLSSPVVADGEIFFGSTDGNIYALKN